jgi:hypothetical protein
MKENKSKLEEERKKKSSHLNKRYKQKLTRIFLKTNGQAHKQQQAFQEHFPLACATNAPTSKS